MSNRIALGLSYDGTHYHGWQWQPEVPTVQTALERAVQIMVGRPVRVVCAGRTDTGVHALNQVVHFDSPKERPSDVWLNGLNAHLPLDVRVHWVKLVSNDFHARFSAKQRHYRYLIDNQPVSSPHLRRLATWIPQKLNIASMQQAALSLIGEHDFSAFRGAHCQSNTPIRRLDELTIVQQGDIIQCDIKANAFLHHMVRNIIGTLLLVGREKQPPEWVAQVLAAQDRRKAGMTAAAHGLYFYDVVYDAIQTAKGTDTLLVATKSLI